MTLNVRNERDIHTGCIPPTFLDPPARDQGFYTGASPDGEYPEWLARHYSGHPVVHVELDPEQRGISSLLAAILAHDDALDLLTKVRFIGPVTLHPSIYGKLDQLAAARKERGLDLEVEFVEEFTPRTLRLLGPSDAAD